MSSNCTINWNIYSFDDPCGTCETSPGLANFKFGNVDYSYDYNGISSSGGYTSATTVIIPTTSTPLFTIGSGWNTSKCCDGWTLYLQSGIPPNSVVNIAIDDYGKSPQWCCTGAIITITNQSNFPVMVNAGGYTGYIMPTTTNTFTCTSPVDTTMSSVQIGPDINGLTPITLLCQSYGASLSAADYFTEAGFESLDSCLADVECTEALVSEEFTPLMSSVPLMYRSMYG